MSAAGLITIEDTALAWVTGGRLIHGKQVELAMINMVGQVATAVAGMTQQRRADNQASSNQAMQAMVASMSAPRVTPQPGGQGGGGGGSQGAPDPSSSGGGSDQGQGG